MRELVTIRTIDEIRPIEGADMIVAVRVDGWVCVAKKGEFEVGDECLYFEIDSILPKGPDMFEFLMERSCKQYHCEDNTIMEGHRLRTIKLRGQISQGLVMPVPEWVRLNQGDLSLDVLLGVKKYEPIIPVGLQGLIRRSYPGWLPKTDQPRVQNLRDIPVGDYEIQEKIEGSSMTVYWDGETIGVTSRAVDLKLDQIGNSFVDTAREIGLLDLFEQTTSEEPEKCDQFKLAVRGELIGPGIQGNIYGLKQTRFVVFDLFAISEDHNGYSDCKEFRKLAEALCEDIDNDRLMIVPRIGFAHFDGEMFQIEGKTLDRAGLIEYADGRSVLGSTPREGIVLKNLTGDRFSFKAISNKYLLKQKD